jgi:hypothetical protein
MQVFLHLGQLTASIFSARARSCGVHFVEERRRVGHDAIQPPPVRRDITNGGGGSSVFASQHHDRVPSGSHEVVVELYDLAILTVTA